jgi:hypothetical protein
LILHKLQGGSLRRTGRQGHANLGGLTFQGCDRRSAETAVQIQHPVAGAGEAVYGTIKNQKTADQSD